jgi:ammonia channel protein AmtB
MDITKVAVLVLLVSVAWFLVGWSVGYKEGVKDGYNRGRAAGMRVASDRVVK